MATKKTPYKRDLDRDIKRLIVRLTKPEREALAKSRSRHGTYAPTVSALVRRGLVLACQELDQKPPQQ
jgi:hypothetical protein